MFRLVLAFGLWTALGGGLVFAQATDDAGVPSDDGAVSDDEARAVYEAGRIAFDDGRYDDALEYFRRAYELSPRPRLLYNIGASADRIRHNREALEAFEDYIEQVPDADNRRAVEARIRVLRTAAARDDALRDSITDSDDTAPKRRWWIGVLVGGLLLAAAAVAVGVAVARDPRPYVRGDDDAVHFTLWSTP